MDEFKKRAISLVCGVVATFFQMYGAIIGLVALAIVFDVITGVVAAKATGQKISSRKANKGFWKKVGLMLALFFGVFLDVFIPQALLVVNITLPFNMPFGLIFGCYITFNEAISICENLNKVNQDILPTWVKKLLVGGAKKIDDQQSENTSRKGVGKDD